MRERPVRARRQAVAGDSPPVVRNSSRWPLALRLRVFRAVRCQRMFAHAGRFPSRWKPKTHFVSLSGWCCSRAERSAMTGSAMPSTGSAWRGGRRLGSWLQQTSAVSEDDITAALAAQWACPVFPLARERSFLRCATMLPMAVIQAARMLPVYMSRDRSSVYIAFVNGIDHSWLRSAEDRCSAAPRCRASFPNPPSLARCRRSSRWSAPRGIHLRQRHRNPRNVADHDEFCRAVAGQIRSAGRVPRVCLGSHLF